MISKDVRFKLNISGFDDSQDYFIFTPPLGKHSKEIKELEDDGCGVIFPAELSEEAVQNMSDEERTKYEELIGRGLIYDFKQKRLAKDFLGAVIEHYYSASHGAITGSDTDEKTLCVFPYGDYDDKVHYEFQKILCELGFQAELEDMLVTVQAPEKLPCVKKEKFYEIYEFAKEHVFTIGKTIKSLMHDSRVNSDDSEYR